MRRRFFAGLAAVIGASGAFGPLQAQSSGRADAQFPTTPIPTSPATPTPDSGVVTGGARADSSSASSPSRGLYAALKRAEQAATEFELPAVMPPSRNEARAMVIVGSIAILVGAVIDDTPGQLIMVGGAAVGLYGLYHYIK